MNDYAKPLMDAERALKEVYDLLLHKDPRKAADRALDVVEHVLIARNVIVGVMNDGKTTVCA